MHWHALKAEVMRRHDMVCYWCGCLTVYYPTIGGEKLPDNFATIHCFKFLIVLACKKCNEVRGAVETKSQPREELQKRSGSVPLSEMSDEALERIKMIGSLVNEAKHMKQDFPYERKVLLETLVEEQKTYISLLKRSQRSACR